MANKKIKDMIATIENFAQEQAEFPVYNILGEIHFFSYLGQGQGEFIYNEF